MCAEETKFAMAKRHVEQGAGHIVKQRALIERLQAGSLATQRAEALLVAFEGTQRLYENHLARIMPEEE